VRRGTSSSRKVKPCKKAGLSSSEKEEIMFEVIFLILLYLHNLGQSLCQILFLSMRSEYS
jgi:hypothetical protein